MTGYSLLVRAGRPLLRPAPAGRWPTVDRLARLVADGLVLHGTSNGSLERLEPRPQTDYFGRATSGVFATRDPIWPIFFAIVDRASAGSLRCACVPGRRSNRYAFSTERDPRWRCSGWIYALDSDGFTTTPGTCELIRRDAGSVVPLERIEVHPDDFPFLPTVGRHVRREPVWRSHLRQRLRPL